ncbi:MAG: hypothetical protein GY733_04265 [bacterium]|nr:hypothetical protein [bacterium]
MPASERWSSLIACSLSWLLPFVIFLRHHDYALLRTDVALAAGAIALAGLAFGVLLTFGSGWVRAVTAAIAITLFLDLQTDWIREAWLAAGAFALSLLACWWLRAGLGRGLAFLAGVMIVATLPMPPGDGWIREQHFEAGTEPDASLPPILHLVLDEQTATGAIPGTLDTDGRVRRIVESAYLDLDFRVFTHAFSRHFTTPPSISHLINLSSGGDSFAFYDRETQAVTQSAYFEALSRRGYQVRVLQTDYIDLCSAALEIRLERCLTYTLESIKALETSGLSLADRAQAIVGSFAQRSHWLQSWRKRYRHRARELAESGVDLPEWPLRAARLSAVSSFAVVPRLEAELASARPGTLVFAHLLLPHFPYAYDRACLLRPSPLDWRTYKDPALRPVRNTPHTRAQRYRLYLEQLECTNRLVTEMLARVLERPALRNAIVIVHGDHGSRISLATPNRLNAERLGPADFRDAFATHFALRSPGVDPALDPRSAAIDSILTAIVKDGRLPEGSDWIGSQQVYLTGERRDQVVQRAMQWQQTAND